MSANRRQYTAEFKAKVVLQMLMGEKTSAEICRSHKLHSSVLNRWRKEFLDHATTIFEADSGHEADQQRIAELERLVGQLTMKLEIAKKASQWLTFDPDSQALELFLSYVQGHVKDALTLAQRLWLSCRAIAPDPPGLIQAHQVHSTMLALVQDLSVTFEALLLLLPPTQARVLESLALDPTESPQASAYIKKHQLSRGGGLQGALTSLEEKGLIYGPQFGYRIALPLLDFWLRQRLR